MPIDDAKFCLVVAHAERLYSNRLETWQDPILDLLRQHSIHTSSWVEACLLSILATYGHERRREFEMDFKRLAELKSKDATAEEILNYSRTIWYRPPGRDAYQTAVAKLFALVGFELAECKPTSQIAASAPLNVLVRENEYSADYFRIACDELWRIVRVS